VCGLWPPDRRGQGFGRRAGAGTFPTEANPCLGEIPQAGIQFLHGEGHCSPGLQTALGPTVGAAHVVARTGIASFTAKCRRYPRVRAARFGHDHLPQRLPADGAPG
jgi:hypothetical protein